MIVHNLLERITWRTVQGTLKTFKGMYSRVKVVPADFYIAVSDAQLHEVVVGIFEYSKKGQKERLNLKVPQPKEPGPRTLTPEHSPHGEIESRLGDSWQRRHPPCRGRYFILLLVSWFSVLSLSLLLSFRQLSPLPPADGTSCIFASTWKKWNVWKQEPIGR